MNYSLIKSLKSNSERTNNVFKNIFFSGIIKLCSIIISLLTVPLTLKFLNQEIYGIWLTIFSIMNWLMYFDGGLGSGLKNKFSKSKSRNELDKIRIYISTSYFVLGITVLVLMILFYIFNYFIDWNSLLNINLRETNLNNFMQIIFVLFCLQFLLRLIESILIADQKSREADFINFISSIISLLIFLLFKNTYTNKLYFIGVVFCGTPIIVNLIYTIILFSNRYKKFAPSIKFINIKYYKDLMQLGTKFFAIQMCNLITVGTINILISNSVNPEMVVVYNLIYRYFGFSLLIFSVLSNSIFSSFNDAFHLSDFNWIKRSVNKIKYFSYLIIFLIIVMTLLSNYFFILWVGNDISIPFYSVLLMSIYFIITIWVTVYATFITGIGKVQLSTYFSILNTLLFLPVTYYSGKYFSLNGILFSQILFIIPGLYWLPKQYNLIINNKAYGIWNK